MPKQLLVGAEITDHAQTTVTKTDRMSLVYMGILWCSDLTVEDNESSTIPLNNDSPPEYLNSSNLESP